MLWIADNVGRVPGVCNSIAIEGFGMIGLDFVVVVATRDCIISDQTSLINFHARSSSRCCAWMPVFSGSPCIGGCGRMFTVGVACSRHHNATERLMLWYCNNKNAGVYESEWYILSCPSSRLCLWLLIFECFSHLFCFVVEFLHIGTCPDLFDAHIVHDIL